MKKLLYNYKKLMDAKPSQLGEHTNLLGQKIVFYEHPTAGETSQVICVCHELELAADSDFFETYDMVAEHREYEPRFIDGKLYHGDMEV